MQRRAPMRTLATAGVAAASALSLLTGVAGASTFTVGSLATPPGAISSDATGCTAVGLAAQTAGASGVLFSTPAGGQITQWQTGTAAQPANAAGEAITLVALAPQSGAYRIDAVDTQTLPNPLPASGVATFTPASSMMVSAGDVLGLAGSANSPNVKCSWISTGNGNGSGTLLDQGLLLVGSPLSAGDVFSPLSNGSLAVPVSGTLVATEDSAVTTAVKPATPTAGSAVLLASTVKNAGPAENTLTFTDAVPSGLTIDAAVSTAGPCTIGVGQVVTCTLSGLSAGQSAPVDIVVTPRAGTYHNTATVAQPSAATDPVTTNNSAKTTFTVSKSIVPKCVLATSLAKLPLSTAKKLLTALNCKVGKVTKSSSSTVAKGDVIKTTPGHGSFTAGKAIAIVESSGPKSKKH